MIGLADLGVDLRMALRLVLVSMALVLLAVYGFQRNAAAKRTALLVSGVTLLLIPFLLLALPLRLPVGVNAPPEFSLNASLSGHLSGALLALWLLPALLRIGVRIRANHRQRQRYFALPPMHEPDVQKLADSIAATLGLRDRPILKLGADCCCLTQPRPVIVLPRALLQSRDALVLRAVLAHELVHAKRRDDRVLLLIRLLQDFYWWMPWLAIFASRFEIAIEESCDDRAADLFSPGHAYLGGVVAACKAAVATQPGVEAAAAMNAQPLLARVQRFANPRACDPDWPGAAAAVALLLCGLLLLTAVDPVPMAEASAAGPAVRVSAPGQSERPVNAGHWVSARAASASEPALLAAMMAHRQYEGAAPIYPGAALIAGREADVIVEFSVGHDGGVTAARVLSGSPGFDHAVLRAVRSSRYPALHQVEQFQPSQWIDRRETGPPLKIQQRFRFRLSRST